jgi:hypothetical protein
MKLLCLALSMAGGISAWAATVYSSLPSPLPPNTPSESYEANALSEFGDLVQLASGPAVLQSATIAMSDWAYLSNWTGSVNGTTITSAGFYEPLTLNLYSAGAGNSVGSLFASYTVDAFIPWRPEPSAACVNAPNNVNNAWLGPDGNCYNGALSTVTFLLGGVSVPDQFIYGVAFNTQDSGYSPTGVSGPYNSLNFGVTLSPPTVGSNPLPQSYIAFSSEYGSPAVPFGYADSSSYIGEIDFQADTPEPTSMTLLGIGLLGICLVHLRRALA